MTDWLSLAQARRDELFAVLEQMVRIESPTSDKAGNDRASGFVTEKLAALGGSVVVDRQAEFGDHVIVSWPGEGAPGFVIGHIDTVWPVGTLARMGYTHSGGRIFGPGVLDMKGGIAATVTALGALKEAGAVYLNAIGGAAQFYARTITAVEGGSLLEFGTPEAMWHLRIADFPAIVTMDAHGNSLHRDVEQESAKELAGTGA